MTTHNDIADRYIALWNETDPARRQALIAGTFAVEAVYRDPMMQGDGHAGIDAMIAGVQERFAGLRFYRFGDADGHGDRLRFSWTLAPDGGEPIARGTDFATVADGRLSSVTGFFDLLPAAAA